MRLLFITRMRLRIWLVEHRTLLREWLWESLQLGSTSSSLSQLRHLKGMRLPAPSFTLFRSSASTMMISLIFSQKKVNPFFTYDFSAFSVTISLRKKMRSLTLLLSFSQASRLSLSSSPSSNSFVSFLMAVLRPSMALSSIFFSSKRLMDCVSSWILAFSFSILRERMEMCSSTISCLLAFLLSSFSSSSTLRWAISSIFSSLLVRTCSNSFCLISRCDTPKLFLLPTFTMLSVVFTTLLCDSIPLPGSVCCSFCSNSSILCTMLDMSSLLSKKVPALCVLSLFLERQATLSLKELPSDSSFWLSFLRSISVILIFSSMSSLNWTVFLRSFSRVWSILSCLCCMDSKWACNLVSCWLRVFSTSARAGLLLIFFSRQDSLMLRSSCSSSLTLQMRLLIIITLPSSSSSFSPVFLSASFMQRRRQLFSYWFHLRIFSNSMSASSDSFFSFCPSVVVIDATALARSSVLTYWDCICLLISRMKEQSLLEFMVTSKKLPHGISISILLFSQHPTHSQNCHPHLPSILLLSPQH